VPYAQPIISTRTGCVVGCEILIRWLHPIKGIIPPDAFIPLAENSGVIVPITYDLMKKVRDDFSKNLIKLPDNFHIAINICPDHLSEESLLEHCQIFMKALGDKIQLILEITERNNFKFTPHVKEKVSMLLDAGVQFALDDFGTGYSTHSYLQKVRAEYVKIDQSFTQMIGVDEISHHIVNNIVHLAESINIKIIAEGVETIEHATYFKEKDIPYQQGYFYGRPVPLNEFTNRVFNSAVIN
jgi:EAL domain-containing protein (putative c-di-GMP-specific phosphodiesterase class I)